MWSIGIPCLYSTLYFANKKKIKSLLCCLQKKKKKEKRCVPQKIENVYNIRIFQIIWISAISPYIVLSILCVKALTLDGAMDGLKFLFTPDWERLKSSECWIDGGTQIFFSYGVGIGALLALGKLKPNFPRKTRSKILKKICFQKILVLPICY